ncbi:hypothetical protein VTJ04DRAFT_5299 [Mycothermus thermophilus]|uniref:uncharacterized protein n=1 Tax=Humicola insolens TaxID=85995 RepID=UPI003744AF2C
MTDTADWRKALTATERYDNIQKLTQALKAAGLTKSAFDIENEAYKTASTREEYDAACNLSVPEDQPGPTTSSSSMPEDDEIPPEPSSPGTTIGSYENCHYIASGVTSAVYRCGALALKVIVETRNMAPHNPSLEAKLLADLRTANAPNIIPLLSTFHSPEPESHLVMVFPYLPFTLADLLSSHHRRCSSITSASSSSSSSSSTKATPPLPTSTLRAIFTALFRALSHLHSQGIIHRDIKPSALLLSHLNLTTTTPDGPQIYLSDFGTAHHPHHSPTLNNEPITSKILDVGTGPYRAPEALFGNRAYTTALDMWSAGCVVAECLRGGSSSLFESRPAHEDGNQLGLVLSIFQTLGTPTRETWPEAEGFRTPPFEMYRVFEGRVKEVGWRGLLLSGLGSNGKGADEWEGWVELVKGCLRYESKERLTAEQALEFACFKETGEKS